MKSAPNGITALSDEDYKSGSYQSWKEENSRSHYSKPEAAGMMGGAGVGGAPYTACSLKDEFRALFPSVNISFGGASFVVECFVVVEEFSLTCS